MHGVHARKDKRFITFSSEALEISWVFCRTLESLLLLFSVLRDELPAKARPSEWATDKVVYTLQIRPIRIVGISVAGMNKSAFVWQKKSLIGSRRKDNTMVKKHAAASEPKSPDCAMVMTL